MDVDVTRVRTTMELGEARHLHSRIKKGIRQTTKCATLLRELVWEFDNGGWLAMGYESLAAAFQQDLRNFSKAHLYKCLKRGSVAETLQLEKGSNVDEGALDALYPLEPEARKTAFQSARLHAGINPVTASIARKAANVEKKEAPKPSGRVTMGELAGNLVRDVDNCIDKAKRLKAPGLELLKDAAAEMRPWANSHKEGEA